MKDTPIAAQTTGPGDVTGDVTGERSDEVMESELLDVFERDAVDP